MTRVCALFTSPIIMHSKTPWAYRKNGEKMAPPVQAALEKVSLRDLTFLGGSLVAFPTSTPINRQLFPIQNASLGIQRCTQLCFSTSKYYSLPVKAEVFDRTNS